MDILVTFGKTVHNLELPPDSEDLPAITNDFLFHHHIDFMVSLLPLGLAAGRESRVGITGS